MTSFRGRSEEPWSLARAVDSMRDAARAAGRPGFVWIAGILYPGLELGLSLGLDGDSSGIPGLRVEGEGARGLVLALVFGGGFLMALLLPIFARLMAGLARVSPPRVWAELAGERGAPALASVWQAGRGLALSAAGMWVLLGLLQRGATLFVLGVAGGFAALFMEAGGDVLGGIALVLLAGPAVALVALYAVTVSVLHQLALHSLAHNRRGVASALVHAWRIARHSPIATARTVAVDLVLHASVLTLAGIAEALIGGGFASFAQLGLAGFAGVARAGFWARAYRALGGLSPDDRVPGLAAPPRAPASVPGGPAEEERW